MGIKCKKIPKSTLKRLTEYLNVLYNLKSASKENISSKELSEIMKITDSQIRKDLSCFKSIGKRGVGYSVDEFIATIEKELGLQQNYNVIIIGAGRLGAALIYYKNLKVANYTIIGAFDNDVRIIGTVIADVKVYDINHLKQFLDENKCDIAVLTVPSSEVDVLYKQLLKLRVRAVLNFTPKLLTETDECDIRNLDIVSDFKILSYRLKERENAYKNRE